MASRALPEADLRTARKRAALWPCRVLAGDERGVTVIEFALFLPILALMVLGTIDIGRGLAAKFVVEQATQRAIERAAQGGPPLADYSFLRSEAAAAAEVPLANVTLDQWLECDNARQSSFNGSCAAGQQMARYVTIEVAASYRPMFGGIPVIGRLANSADGTFRITANSGVRVQ